MASTEAGAEVSANNIAAVETKENAHNDVGAEVVDESSHKKAKTEENASPDKKRRSSGRKGRCDIDIMEEAKAAYGDLDSTEGRRLRKRPDPPKVETPPPAKRRSGGPGRKKATKEDEDQTATDNSKKNEKEDDKTDGLDTAESKVDDAEAKTEDTSEQKQSCNDASLTESSPVPDIVVEKPTGEAAPASQTESDVKSNGDGSSATVEAGSTE